jgi:hypothetical protein
MITHVPVEEQEREHVIWMDLALEMACIQSDVVALEYSRCMLS